LGGESCGEEEGDQETFHWIHLANVTGGTTREHTPGAEARIFLGRGAQG
jgi:hypothetical protein